MQHAIGFVKPAGLVVDGGGARGVTGTDPRRRDIRGGGIISDHDADVRARLEDRVVEIVRWMPKGPIDGRGPVAAGSGVGVGGGAQRESCRRREK